MPFCKKCGAQVFKSFSSCKKCGNAMQDDDDSKQIQETAEDKSVTPAEPAAPAVPAEPVAPAAPAAPAATAAPAELAVPAVPAKKSNTPLIITIVAVVALIAVIVWHVTSLSISVHNNNYDNGDNCSKSNSDCTDSKELFAEIEKAKNSKEKVEVEVEKVGSNLSLTIIIANEYLEFWARGGILPRYFYKQINSDLVVINRESEDDPGKILKSVYSKSDSAYIDGNNEFITDLSAIKPGAVVATLSENSSRRLACGQSGPDVEDICDEKGRLAVTLKNRSVYDEIARDLIMIHNRFIDSPDGDKVVIVFENDIDNKKIANVAERAKNAGFSKIILTKYSNIFTVGSGDSRSKQEIMAVVNARMPDLRNIYNKYLKLKPGFSGKVTLKFTIAPGGDIISIAIVSSTTDYSEFDDAIKNMVATWKWKQIKGGYSTSIIPFNFTE